MKKIAKFHKVSYGEFEKAWKGEFPEAKEDEIKAVYEELKLPKQVKNVIKCKNPRCVTSIEQELDQIFILADEEKEVYRCKYCEEKYTNPNRRQIKVM